MGDDDDREGGDDQVWKQYFTKAVEEAESIVCTRKANGEAAHVSAVDIDGQLYVCAGSKNVHLIFKERAEIEKYSTSRFKVAQEIAYAVWDMLHELPKENQERLLKFLAKLHLTAVFEILLPDHQHVVNLSYLSKPQLHFVTFTSNNLSFDEETELCTFPPDVALQVAKALCLTTVEYERISAAEAETRITSVRQGYLYEGEVFYFMDKSGNVIGLLKKKTSWYILCRAIREKLRAVCISYTKQGPSNFNLKSFQDKIERRLVDIQKWLGLSPAALQEWKKLSMAFLKWCLFEMSESRLTVSDITDKFPVTWSRFLDLKKLSDAINPFQDLKADKT